MAGSKTLVEILEMLGRSVKKADGLEGWHGTNKFFQPETIVRDNMGNIDYRIGLPNDPNFRQEDVSEVLKELPYGRFRSDYNGRGIGQAFGAGSYLADIRPVAEGFRNDMIDMASSRYFNDPSIPPVPSWVANELERGKNPEVLKYDFEKRLQEAIEGLSSGYQPHQWETPKKTAQDTLSALDAYIAGAKLNQPGYLIKSVVHVDPNDLMKWNTPLVEQPSVMSAIDNRWGDPEIVLSQMGLDPERAMGGDFYTKLARSGGQPSKEQASQVLSEAGVPGIEYMHQGFPKSVKDAKNYVIFDPRMIEITDRFANGGSVYQNDDIDAAMNIANQYASGGRIAKAGAGKVIGEGIEAALRLAGKEAPAVPSKSSRLAEAKKFIDEFYSDLYDHPFDPDMKAHGFGPEQFAFYKLKPTTGTAFNTLADMPRVSVDWFQAFPMNQGIGRKGMQKLQDAAAAKGIALELSPYDKGIVGTEGLNKFYSKMGFGPVKGISRTLEWVPNKIEDTTDKRADGGRIAKAGAGKVIGEGIDYLTKLLSGTDEATNALRLAERDRLLQASGPEYSRTYQDLAKKGLTQSGYASKLKFGKPVEDYSAKLRTKGTLQPWQETDIEKLVREGASIYPALGDRSAANQFVTEIGGVPLTFPVNLQAGGDFGRSEFGVGKDAAYWASRQGAATKMINRLINDQLREEGPSYMTHVAMGYPNLDSTHMVRQGVFRAIPNMNIANKDIALFNEVVRKNYPDFPGAENAEEAEAFLNSIPGSNAADIVSTVEQDRFIKRGFPSLLETRWAVSEPRLMDVPPLTSGYSIGQVDTKGAVPPRALAHETYGKQIPLVGEVSGLKHSVPASVMFPEWWAGLKPHVQADSTKAQHLMMMQFPRQKATQEWLDNLRAYQEAHKDVYGYNQGGRADIEAALQIARQHKAGGGGVATVRSYQEPENTSIYGELPELPYDQNKSFNTGEQVRSLYDAYMPNAVRPYVDAAATVVGNPAAFNPMGQAVTEARGATPNITPYTGGDFGGTFMDFTAGPIVNVGVNTATGRPVQTEDYIDTALNLGGGALLAKGLPYVKPVLDASYRGIKAMLPAAAGVAGLTVGSEDAQAAGAGLFSKAMKAVRELPMNKMSGSQALAMLKNSGVGSEELQWLGLADMLPTTGSVTKDQLSDLVAKNDVQLNEVIRGGTKPSTWDKVRPTETASAPFMDEWNSVNERIRASEEKFNAARNAGQPYATRDAEDELNMLYSTRNNLHERMVAATIDEMGGLGKKTKFGPDQNPDWSLAGGQNYQETLITLPPGKKEIVEWPVLLSNGHANARFTDRQSAENYARHYGYEVGEPQITNLETGFRSQHWPELNVIAHIRTNQFDAVNPEGGPSLKAFNLDEIQSDWGQQGKKKGFKNTGTITELPQGTIIHPPGNQYSDIYALELLQDVNGRNLFYGKTEEEAKANALAFINSPRPGSAPSGPYVQSTNQWVDLGLKKAVSQAIDSGSDVFTWTPGKISADRYDLSKSVDRITFLPNDDGTYHVGTWLPEGDTLSSASGIMDLDKIEKTFGKEVAKKVKNGEFTGSEGGSNISYLQGNDLSVGGKGMIDFYDNIVPKRLSEVIRKATGEKPQFQTWTIDTIYGPTEVQGFRFTPEMKTKLQAFKEKEGGYFPHFANGGKVDDSSINKALQIAAEASV